MTRHIEYILYQESSGGLVRYKGENGPTTRKSEAKRYLADMAAWVASQENWLLEVALLTTAGPESPPALQINVTDRATGKLKGG